MARPSDYSPETAAEICTRIADGQSLREIARADDMPAKSTILRWLDQHPEFQDQYARAREAQADHFGEEILEIADDGRNDWMARQNDGGEDIGPALNSEHIQRSRLRVDARKWLMSKLAPKKYGEKVEHAVGGIGGGPVIIERVIVDPKAPDPDGAGL